MSTQGVWIVFLYLLSFFWTEQIINNLQHTIVASMIGTWWYNPTDANFCWDDGLNRSICHSLTYSFGSICFGSLLAGVVQALKWVHRISSRPTNRCARCITACIDCILSCVQEAIEYFNKWYVVVVVVVVIDWLPKVTRDSQNRYQQQHGGSFFSEFVFFCTTGPLPLSESMAIVTLVRAAKWSHSSNNAVGRVWWVTFWPTRS